MSNIKDSFYFDRAENKLCSLSTQHYHGTFEIYYLKEGICHYFIGNTSFEVTAGDLVIIPVGTIHRTQYSSKPCTRLLINFSKEFISEEIIEHTKSIGFLYRNERALGHVDSLFEMIEDEYKRGDELSTTALKCYLETLLLLLIRNSNGKEINKEEYGVVEKAVRYIQENYMNPVRLSLVAEAFSVSEEHLSRIFKKKTGFGFNEYLTTLRLQKAEYMLKNEPGRSVSDIAYACGFNDSNYFSYKFKKEYGISPKEARKKEPSV